MSNKRKKYEKHPYSVRLQVVAKVLCEHLPLRTTGKMFDVNPRQVKYWVSLYSRYGEEGLRMQHRYYPVDFKYKVLQDVFENHFSIHTLHFAVYFTRSWVCRSTLQHPHSGQISRKLWRTSCRKPFSTTLYHNPDNLFIRFAHTFLRQLSHVPDGIFHTVGNDSITAIELLSLYVHFIAHDSGIDCC